MEFIIGFIVGYWLSNSIEPLDLEETNKAWQKIRKSEQFQTLLDNSSDVAKQLLEQGADTFVEEAASAASSRLTLWQRTRLFIFGEA